MVGESAVQHPGQQAVLSRITEVLFVEVLRSWIGSLGPGEGGWLGAMADPHIGRALQPIHELPDRPWTLRELGRHAGFGRSAFSARFTRLVGQPVRRYLVARVWTRPPSCSHRATTPSPGSPPASAMRRPRRFRRRSINTTVYLPAATGTQRHGRLLEGWKETSRRTDRTGISGRRGSWRRMGRPTRGDAIDSGCGPGRRSSVRLNLSAGSSTPRPRR
jgi:Cupin